MNENKQAEPVACQYCNGTGDVHGIDGEWRGECKECKPAVAQEPVHFRAVLCGEQQDQAFGVVPKVVGFVDKKAAEQFILEKRDFQGWRYSLEPLYTEAPAVADFSDAYQGAQEDLAIWKKRALEAEELNRKFIADINGQTFMGEPAPAAAINEQAQRDAERYRWLRDSSVPPHNFYLSVPVEFDGVKYTPQEVDNYIDAAIEAAKGGAA